MPTSSLGVKARACSREAAMTQPTDVPLPPLDGWALILGASSGFGAAAAVALARAGVDIIGVHLDRRATMPNVERIIARDP